MNTLYSSKTPIDGKFLVNKINLVVDVERVVPTGRQALWIRPHTHPDIGHCLRSNDQQLTGDKHEEGQDSSSLDVRPDHIPANLRREPHNSSYWHTGFACHICL